MSRTRHRFNEISHRFGLGIKFNHKPFLPFFNMKCSRGVHETEASWAVHNFNDAAEIHGPEKRGVSLHSYQLPRCNLRSGIRDSHPSQIEFFPSLKGFARSDEDRQSLTKLAAGKIVRKTSRWSSEQTGYC